MNSISVPVGHTLTVTQPADSAGTYRRLHNPGATPYAPVAMNAAAAVTIGPFDSVRHYEILSNNGEATYSVNDAAASLPAGVVVDGTALAPTITELNYVDGVTSALQTQLGLKAPLASPTFTGTVVLPSTTSIATVSATEIGYLDGVTSAIQTQFTDKANLASPTFSGTVVLPSTTSIGNVTNTELSYVDGVTSGIQAQLDAKATAGVVPTVTPYSTTTDGALNVVNTSTIEISKSSAGAYTLTTPTQDGKLVYITSTTAYAHVITATSLLANGAAGTPYTTATFGAYVGASLLLMGNTSSGYWHVISATGVVIS